MFGAEGSWQRDFSELVERIYWEGKPPPRHKAARSSGAAESIAELYGDMPPKQQNIEIRKIAERLGLTVRHVRRILTQLLRARKIPQAWLRGRQWRPPVDEAVEVITREVESKHAPHTKARADDVIGYVMNCRDEAARLKRELAEIEAICETCEHWRQLTRTVAPENATVTEKTRHREEELHRAYDFMAKLAEKRGWRFCRLFVAMFEALRTGSKTPVKDANALLALNHAAFYRNFTIGERTGALLLAQKALANPDWLAGQPQIHSEDDGIAGVFSDWRNKVSEAQLWVDTH